jgi:hypothetical protein
LKKLKTQLYGADMPDVIAWRDAWWFEMSSKVHHF